MQGGRDGQDGGTGATMSTGACGSTKAVSDHSVHSHWYHNCRMMRCIGLKKLQCPLLCVALKSEHIEYTHIGQIFFIPPNDVLDEGMDSSTQY